MIRITIFLFFFTISTMAQIPYQEGFLMRKRNLMLIFRLPMEEIRCEPIVRAGIK